MTTQAYNHSLRRAVGRRYMADECAVFLGPARQEMAPHNLLTPDPVGFRFQLSNSNKVSSGMRRVFLKQQSRALKQRRFEPIFMKEIRLLHHSDGNDASLTSKTYCFPRQDVLLLLVIKFDEIVFFCNIYTTITNTDTSPWNFQKKSQNA